MKTSYCSILRSNQIWRRLSPLRDRIGHFIDLTRRARRARCPNLSDSFRRAAPRSRVGYTLALAGTVLAALAPAHGEELAAQRIPIAVADLDYADTSGEVRNQQAEHEARLRAFVDRLRADLEQDGRYRTVTLECGQSPCTAGRSGGTSLVESARAAGARLLLYGGIQKMSTLVQYSKVQVVDLQANKLVFDRLISFRGDTDESWQHAERFLVRELRSANLLSQ
jgi:Protein of unknown function (DUF2380)